VTTQVEMPVAGVLAWTLWRGNWCRVVITSVRYTYEPGARTVIENKVTDSEGNAWYARNEYLRFDDRRPRSRPQR
jgi:hypothetical protein